MESRKFERYSHSRIDSLHNIFYKPGHTHCHWLKETKYPNYTKNIKYQVSHCRSSRLRITCQSRQISSNGRTDIFTQYQCRAQFETNPPICTHNQRNSHGSSGSLHNHCQYRTNQDKENHRSKTHIGVVLNERKHFRILSQVWRISLQERKPHEQERETEDKFTNRLAATLTREKQRYTNSQ